MVTVHLPSVIHVGATAALVIEEGLYKTKLIVLPD